MPLDITSPPLDKTATALDTTLDMVPPLDTEAALPVATHLTGDSVEAVSGGVMNMNMTTSNASASLLL